MHRLRSGRRPLLMNSVQPTFLCGSEVQVFSLRKQIYIKRLPGPGVVSFAITRSVQLSHCFGTRGISDSGENFNHSACCQAENISTLYLRKDGGDEEAVAREGSKASKLQLRGK